MPKLQIDKLAFGGAGFGRLDGKACFVPYTAPGDLVDVTITKSKSSYLEGEVNRVDSPASCRVTPVCPVFGRCGGCNWQHISYDAQCRQKELIFAETMWRMARVGAESISPLLAASDPLGYRQRIQLKVYCRDDRLFLGFYRSGSHYVVDLPDGCAIARAELTMALDEIRGIISSSPERDRIPQVDLSVGEDGTITALFHYIGNDRQGIHDYLAGLQGRVEHVSAICLQMGRKDTIKSVFGPETMEYTLPCDGTTDLTMSYSADCFSQVNFHQNRRIVDIVLSWAVERRVNAVLDLFCGNGNFSLPLSRCAASILGMESYARSIELAQHNARQNGIANVTFLCEDAANGVRRLADEGSVFDLIILDPPRSGASMVVSNLKMLHPAYLIYVSCDPPTLGRDLALLQKNGFRVERIQPVDMFPQTYHLESVTFLHAD